MGSNNYVLQVGSFPFKFQDALGNFVLLDPSSGISGYSYMTGAFQIAQFSVDEAYITYGDTARAVSIVGTEFQVAITSEGTLHLWGENLQFTNQNHLFKFDAAGLFDIQGNLKVEGGINAVSYGFTSANQTIDGSKTSYKVAHGLGRVPQKVWAELVCTNADSNSAMAVGDILEIDALNCTYGGAFQNASYFGDATYCEVALIDALLGNEAYFKLVKRGGGAAVSISSFNNFVLVLHAI